MANFIATVSFTPQGAADIKSSPKRADAFRAMASELRVTIRELLWTQGPFDGLIVMDAPDDETAAAVMLRLAAFGNVTTQTARAFNAEEMQQILEKMKS